MSDVGENANDDTEDLLPLVESKKESRPPRAKRLRALKELLDSLDLEEEEEAQSPPPRPAKKAVVSVEAPPPPSGKRAATAKGKGTRLVNALSVIVFLFAVLLYLAPELIIGNGQVSSSSAGGGGATRQKALHPEWPLHTFETAAGRKLPRQIGKAVVSDTTLYDKVLETLSYHLVNGNKRVLCMWHLALPLSTSLTNVCVWKRRATTTSIASLLFSQWQGVDEGLLLPMYNLDIKGEPPFGMKNLSHPFKKGYSLNTTKTVTETSILCGRSRLVARKRRPVVDIAFETVKHWSAVRLLIDEDEESAFALQQAWEEARGYKCDHDY